MLTVRSAVDGVEVGPVGDKSGSPRPPWVSSGRIFILASRKLRPGEPQIDSRLHLQNRTGNSSAHTNLSSRDHQRHRDTNPIGIELNDSVTSQVYFRSSRRIRNNLRR